MNNEELVKDRYLSATAKKGNELWFVWNDNRLLGNGSTEAEAWANALLTTQKQEGTSPLIFMASARKTDCQIAAGMWLVLRELEATDWIGGRLSRGERPDQTTSKHKDAS